MLGDDFGRGKAFGTDVVFVFGTVEVFGGGKAFTVFGADERLGKKSVIGLVPIISAASLIFRFDGGFFLGSGSLILVN